ncbi:hypothetical protein [Gordonia sp. SND2]|uniref:hypothetical protein n=1 Tax=Gordonia sp. SND2 TaxID=3388659 RepID=UPI00398AE67E
MNVNRLVANVLADALQTQPWYKRNANTVVAIASAVVTLGTWLTATYVDSIPTPVAVVIGFLVALASIIVTKMTPNGITTRGNEKVETAVATELQHYTVQARQTAAEIVDPIAEAVARGWSEHDPRYIGMTTLAAARAFLTDVAELRDR